jgi:hypothetical protein
MCDTGPRKLRVRRPWPPSFDATHQLVDGATDGHGLGVRKLDRQCGLGDVDGHSLPGLGAAGCDLLAGDRDEAGAGRAPLHGAGFGGGPGNVPWFWGGQPDV